MKQRIDHPELLDGAPGDATGLDGAVGLAAAPSEVTSWSWWGGATKEPAFSDLATSTLSAIGSLPTQVSNALSTSLAASDPDAILSATESIKPTLGNLNGEDVMRLSSAANEWMAFALVTCGAFLFIGGCLNYYRAVRFSRAIHAGMNGDEEARVVS